jgi:putative hydrolase of the HAD superfamily
MTTLSQSNLPIKAIFVDIGGVLLTNGWDRRLRQHAAEIFHLNLDELNERHHLVFGAFEEGRISLDDYLQQVIFYTPRSFTRPFFKDFILAQAQPYPDMIDLVCSLKERYGIKIATVSNEGRELMVDRIHRFGLHDFIDVFVASCFLHIRKPEVEIYKISLDIMQLPPSQIIYIEDRAQFVEVAESVGLQGILHTTTANTRDLLAARGLSL